MSFGITPVAGFPPETPDEFPAGLQWRLSGVNVGTREVDTVNFVSGDTLAMAVDPGDPKILTITIPTGGEGGAVPNLVVQLDGVDPGLFDGVFFADWDATVSQESADAEWSIADGGVKFLAAGLFRVTLIALANADAGVWPTDELGGSVVTQYGSVTSGTAASIAPGAQSVHERSATQGGTGDGSPGFVQWTDEYVVEAAVDDITVPSLYARHYQGEGTGVFFSGLLVVTKL
jgi:hypothetical protein